MAPARMSAWRSTARWLLCVRLRYVLIAWGAACVVCVVVLPSLVSNRGSFAASESTGQARTFAVRHEVSSSVLLWPVVRTRVEFESPDRTTISDGTEGAAPARSGDLTAESTDQRIDRFVAHHTFSKPWNDGTISRLQAAARRPGVWIQETDSDRLPLWAPTVGALSVMCLLSGILALRLAEVYYVGTMARRIGTHGHQPRR